MRKLSVLGLVFLGFAALAQEPPPPPPEGDFDQPRRRQDQGRGRGRLDPARMAKLMAARRGGDDVEIAAHGDSIYVVTGQSIFRVTAATMKIAAKGTLEDPEAAAGEETERRERMMKKHDKDGDGQISRDEHPKPEMFDRADRNGDGFITLDELRVPGGGAMRAPRGPVKIIAGRTAVYVLRGNVLYKLDPSDLSVVGSARLQPEEKERRRPDRGARGGEFGGGRGAGGRGAGGPDFEF